MSKISKKECIDYLSSWAETLEDKVGKKDKLSLLYEEQIVFLKATLKILKSEE